MFGSYIGRHENKIDQKGRLSIPAAFRNEIEQSDPNWSAGQNAQMVVVWGDVRRNFVEVLPIPVFEKIKRQILALDNRSAKRADLVKIYAMNAQACTMDETGRIVLPPKAREKLALDGLALIVGCIDTFHIYHPDRFEEDDLGSVVEEDDYDRTLDPKAYIRGEGTGEMIE